MVGEGKKPERNRDRFRRWPEEVESKFPMLPCPEGSKFTIKQVAYLHIYCKESPQEIVNRFPKQLSLGQVHLALAHYYLTEKKTIDSELANEFRLNRRDALLENSLSLPSFGRTSLVETPEIERPARSETSHTAEIPRKNARA